MGDFRSQLFARPFINQAFFQSIGLLARTIGQQLLCCFAERANALAKIVDHRAGRERACRGAQNI